MTRLLFAVVLLSAMSATLPAAPVPVVPPDLTKDREGNPLPPGATARLGSLAFRGPMMYAVSYSDDGKTLHASSGWNLLSWDAETGKPLPTKSLAPPGKEKEPGPEQFAAGDRLFAVEMKPREFGMRGEPDGAVVVRDRTTGTELCRIPCTGHLNFAPYYVPVGYAPSAAVSADGKYAAIVSRADKTVEVYRTDTGKRLHVQPIEPYNAGTIISPDNKTLYIIDYAKPVRRCELVSGKALPDLIDTDKATDRLAVSPDGKLVATRGTFADKDERGQVRGTGYNGFLAIHDTVANKVVRKIELGETPIEFAFAGPDAVLVLTWKRKPPLSATHTLSRWNLTTGKREWEAVNPYTMDRLTVSPDGKRASLLHSQHVIHTFDAVTGKPAASVAAHAGPVAWVGWSADGRAVHTASGDDIMSWTLKGERTATAAPRGLSGGRLVPFVPGGPLVWVAPVAGEDKKAELVAWDFAAGAVAWRLPVGEKVPDRVYSHDGKQVVALCWDKDVKGWRVTVYDAPGGKVRHERTLTTPNAMGPTWSPGLALSGDGKRLFVAAADVQALDLATGKQERFADAGPTRAEGGYSEPPPFAVSSDGARLVVFPHPREDAPRGPAVLNVHEVKSGKRLASHELEPLHLPGVAFAQTGKHVAVWSVWGTVVVYNAESDAKPRKLTVAGARPTCAAFSPNGASLAVGYQDGTTLLWDLTAK